MYQKDMTAQKHFKDFQKESWSQKEEIVFLLLDRNICNKTVAKKKIWLDLQYSKSTH